MTPQIANSEQGVNSEVRYLRRAIPRLQAYQRFMKLKLKELRLKKGWSQEEVASRSGMSKSFYSEIEGGKKAANSHRLQKFAEVFGVSPFELIDDESIDAAIIAHLDVLRTLSDQDRSAVIRHALGLAADKAPSE